MSMNKNFRSLFTCCLLGIAALSMGFYSKFKLSSDSAYRNQLDTYKEAYDQLKKHAYRKSLDIFDEITTPMLISKDFFYYHKGLAQVGTIKKGDECDDDKFLSLLNASISFKIALGGNPSKYFERQIKLKLIETLLQQLNCAEKKPDARLIQSILADLSGYMPANGVQVGAFLHAQLLLKNTQVVAQTINNYRTLLSKPDVLATFTPEDRLFIKKKIKEAVPAPTPIEADADDDDDSNKHPLTIIMEEQVDPIKQASKVFTYLSSGPLLTANLAKKAATALYSGYDKEQKANANSKKPFSKQLNNDYRKLPVIVLIPLVDLLWEGSYFQPASKVASFLVKDHPDLVETEKLLFNLGRIEEDSHDFKKALGYFNQYVLRGKGNPLYEEALFHTGWCQYMMGSKQTITAFVTYLNEFPDGSHATGVRYFLAQHARKLHVSEDLAKGATEDLINKYPLSLYSIMSRKQMKFEAPVDPQAFFIKKDELDRFNKQPQNYGVSYSDQLHLAKYRELVAIGDISLADRELAAIGAELSKPAFMYYLTTLFGTPENSSMKINMLTTLSRDPNYKNLITLKDIFPQIYDKEIKAAIKRSNLAIDSVLIMSLIRQESAFDHEAESAKDAQGLMQLLESTAKKEADDLRLWQHEDLNLFDPAQNTVLGVAHFKKLLTQYNGRVYYVLAAYNAGEKPVDRWIKARGDLTPIEFIETIPYKETRFYVLAIMRNYVIYSYLYNKTKLEAIEVPFKI